MASTNRFNHHTVKYNNSGVQQWAAAFTNGSFAFTGDEQRSVVAASNLVLSNGDVFVTGAADNGGAADYVIIQYNSSGAQQWIATFNGTGNGKDYISDLDVLSTGAVVITGESFGSSSNADFVTIQYEAAGGTQNWLQSYNGIANGADRARGLDIDNANNIYVTGVSHNGTNNDFATVKYSTEGIEQWDMVFNGLANGNDEANDIGVDASGNVYVVGLSFNGSNFDYATVKYGLKEVFQPLDFSLVNFGIQEIPSQSHTYYTNKGQIVDIFGNPRQDIKLYTNFSSPAIFITDSALSYVFSQSTKIPPDTLDTMPSTFISGQRVDMKLAGGNPGARVFKTEQAPGHLNYFLAHIPQGITKVGGFNKAVSPDVYPNIDMQYYSNSKGLKFYFIVHPGGNADDIVLRFAGANAVNVTDAGRLNLSTNFGDMFFDAGHAYQINPGNNVVPMPWQAEFIKVSANEVKFDIRNYPKNMPLIIQVDRGHQLGTVSSTAEWLSHLGGSQEDKVFGVTTDSQGNVYYIGQTASADFPVDTGAFQDTLINTFNNSDAFVAGFDFEYRKKFITYIGGGLPDWGNSVSWSSTNGMLYIAGETRGGPNDLGLNFPTRNLGGNSYFDSLYSNGSFETGFIGRMDTASGIPDWLSYYGGTKAYITKLTHDSAGNVYIVGIKEDTLSGNSTTCNNPPNGGFPLCNLGGTAYYQGFHAGGSTDSTGTDGFLSKFSASGVLLHSTFFGGDNPGNSGDDFIYDIAIDNVSNAIYIVGSTNSQRFSAPACGVPVDGSFPICFSGGGYAESILNSGVAGTQHDAFLAKFDLTTLELLRSTYFGSADDDVATGIAINSAGEKYIVGHTNSLITGSPLCAMPTNDGFPYCASGLPFVTEFSAGQLTGYKKFIAKFNINDSLGLSRAIKGKIGNGDKKQVVAQLSLISPRIAINSDKIVFVIGTTWDPYLENKNFEGNYYYQELHGDSGSSPSVSDAFVSLFNPGAVFSTLITFIGGSGNQTYPFASIYGDVGLAIATYQNTRVYIGGFTYSNTATSFPTSRPATPSNVPYFQDSCASCNSGISDAFIGQIQIGPFTGIEELPFENNQELPFTIYPNPANHEITLKFDLPEKTDLYFKIYNIIGEVIYSEKQKYQPGTFKKQLDLSWLSKGLYLITVTSEKATHSMKVIIQ